MSRIGKKPVPVGKTKITIKDQHVVAEGPKGRLEMNVHPLIKVSQTDGNLVVVRPNDEKQSKALHGLTRALLANMIEGVTNGYKRSLEVQGVGYKAELRGKNLVLSVGYSNQITLSVPAGVTMTLEGTNKIHLTGFDKQLVGQFASDIRRVRKPEPYKGKGIRYEGEHVARKVGKRA